MGFMDSMALANYGFESGTSKAYEVFATLIIDNQEILTPEQLEQAESFLLPPDAFDDGKTRDKSQYEELTQQIHFLKKSKIDQTKTERSK